MKSAICHNFKTKAHSLPRLFEGVTKMLQLMRKIEQEAIMLKTLNLYL